MLLLLSHFSCVWLCNLIDGSPPGSPAPGILQARTLEWVAISFSNAWKWNVEAKLLSRVRLLMTPWTAAYQAPPSMGFPRQEYWSGVPLLSPLRKWETHNFINPVLKLKHTFPRRLFPKELGTWKQNENRNAVWVTIAPRTQSMENSGHTRPWRPEGSHLFHMSLHVPTKNLETSTQKCATRNQGKSGNWGCA